MDDRHTTARWGRPTRWTVIRRAARGASPAEVAEAWESLVERYREPVAQTVRHHLRGHPEAESIAEDFFAYLYSHDILARAREESGLFRAFMQGVIRRYVLTAWRDKSRGGLSLDPELDESIQVADGPTELELHEETLWAEGVLTQAAQRLAIARPREAEILFRSVGIAPHALTPRKQLATEYGLTETNLKQIIFRAKNQLREFIVEEVGDTAEGDELIGEIGLVRDRLIAARPDLFATKAEFDDADDEAEDHDWSDAAEEHHLGD
ncbi:MAG: sigma-70 family RNA polymerase sigma factor [Planctomycetota bacterium]